MVILGGATYADVLALRDEVRAIVKEKTGYGLEKDIREVEAYKKEACKMHLLIVSGLSGAGKSVAMNALEDIGFFCIDNIPAALLPSITAFSKAGDNQLKRVALCMDIRGCRTPEEIEEALSQLDAHRIEYEILFLDAPDDVLMRRYSETRRRHPMSISDGLSTREAFRREREILQPLKDRADYTINTGLLSPSQNKERICDLFNQNGGAKSAMRLTVM